MKKNFWKMPVLIMASALTVIVFSLSSCGSSKPSVQATNSEMENPYGKQVFQTECEKLAEQAPGKRSYGSAQHFKESSARELAEADARAQMSRKLDAAIISASKAVGFDITKYSGSDTQGMSVTDGGGQTNNFVHSLSMNVIQNTSVIKTEKFLGKDRKYTVFVCVEYGGAPADLAKAAADAVKDRVSPADRSKIQAENAKFEKEVMDMINKK